MSWNLALAPRTMHRCPTAPSPANHRRRRFLPAGFRRAAHPIRRFVLPTNILDQLLATPAATRAGVRGTVIRLGWEQFNAQLTGFGKLSGARRRYRLRCSCPLRDGERLVIPRHTRLGVLRKSFQEVANGVVLVRARNWYNNFVSDKAELLSEWHWYGSMSIILDARVKWVLQEQNCNGSCDIRTRQGADGGERHVCEDVAKTGETCPTLDSVPKGTQTAALTNNCAVVKAALSDVICAQQKRLCSLTQEIYHKSREQPHGTTTLNVRFWQLFCQNYSPVFLQSCHPPLEQPETKLPSVSKETRRGPKQ